MKKIVIIGGGASGFFAAANLPKGKFDVKIFERSSKTLNKVRVSGGGRCNVTHHCFNPVELSGNYPRGNKELKGVFSRFSVADTIDWFEKRGVKLKTEADGRMFPITNDSQSIINCLMNEVLDRETEIKLNTSVTNIEPNNGGYDVFLQNGDKIYTDYIIVASGGSPKIGGYDFLNKLNININAPVPSLFTFNLPGNTITTLMGLSVPAAKVKIVNTKLEETGPLLITHWGFSGPCVLKLSAWGAKVLSELKYDFNILVSWMGDMSFSEIEGELNKLAADKKRLVSTKPLLGIPQRLWKYLLTKVGIDENTQWANLPKKKYMLLLDILHKDLYSVKGKTTFKEEFVTCGGVSLKEIDLTTMQSRKHSGLFFTGEVLDVDGITGGFNFQHAWASGFIASQAIINKNSAEK